MARSGRERSPKDVPKVGGIAQFVHLKNPQPHRQRLSANKSNRRADVVIVRNQCNEESNAQDRNQSSWSRKNPSARQERQRGIGKESR